MERCDQCGFVYDSTPTSGVAEGLRSLAPRYASRLRAAEQDSLAWTRPQSSTWSAVEYACHVRDVLLVQAERLQLALQQQRLVFAPMRRDERAGEERYNDQQVKTVLAELTEAAERFADALERLDGQQWQRTAVYPWPHPAERSMAWLARHTLHEGLHHFVNIVAGVEALRASLQQDCQAGR